MNKKSSKILIFSFILIIYVFFFSLLIGRVIKNKIVEVKDQSVQDSIKIDWEKLYPYNKTIDTIEVNTVEKKESRVEKAENTLLKLGRLGPNWSRNMYKYDDIAKAGFILRSRLSDPSVGNTYVKLKNGYWTQISPEPLSEDAANQVAAKYASLQNYVEKVGSNFVYFYAPVKDCKQDSQLPDGVITYSNQIIDGYVKAMDSYNVNFVDMRNLIHNEGLNHYNMYYVTDHHWTVESGLWAASEITKEIKDRFELNMEDPKKIGDYEYVTYENAEFGSAGVGVTHFVADAEDFTIPYPTFSTNFRLEVPSKDVNVTGEFRDIFVEEEKIHELMAEGGGSAYGKILYGNQPYEKITNLNNKNAPKVLMIKDSFGISVAPYLAESCSELMLIDVRPSNGNFTGSIVNCIDSFQPDVVVVLLNGPYNFVLNK